MGKWVLTITHNYKQGHRKLEKTEVQTRKLNPNWNCIVLYLGHSCPLNRGASPGGDGGSWAATLLAIHTPESDTDSKLTSGCSLTPHGERCKLLSLSLSLQISILRLVHLNLPLGSWKFRTMLLEIKKLKPDYDDGRQNHVSLVLPGVNSSLAFNHSNRNLYLGTNKSEFFTGYLCSFISQQQYQYLTRCEIQGVTRGNRLIACSGTALYRHSPYMNPQACALPFY